MPYKLYFRVLSMSHESMKFLRIFSSKNTSTHNSSISCKNYGFIYCIMPESHLHELTYNWISSKVWNYFTNKLFLINNNNQFLCFLHPYAKQLSQPEPDSLSGSTLWMLFWDMVLNAMLGPVQQSMHVFFSGISKM